MMPIKFDKVFSKMKEKGLTTYRIRKEKIISESTMQKFRHGKNVNTESIEILCKILECQPGVLMEYVPEDNEK